jgi:hypothetical protein
MVTTTAFWSAGATSEAHLTISDGDARLVLSDTPSQHESAPDLAEAHGTLLAGQPGYGEVSVEAASVLGNPGVRRAYATGDEGARTTHLAWYAVVGKRAIVIAAAEDAAYLLDAVSLAAPSLPVERFHEIPFAVRRGTGWTLHERMVLTRHQTGHRVTAESFDLPGGTTPDMWAMQRGTPYQSAGWQALSTRSGKMLGRPSMKPTSGIGDVARLLDGVPAQVQTLRHADSSGTQLVRIWTAVVDGRGYSVITTLAAGDSGFKLLAAHALLRPGPNAASATRAWRTASVRVANS